MQQYYITANSATVGYQIKRIQTEDGSDSVFKNIEEAKILAEAWINMLNEEKFAQADDWVLTVEPSPK